MNDIILFRNPEFGDIRTVVVNGEPWLVGKDVATALGYKETAKAVREHVDADDRGVSKMDTPSGTQEMAIINESGLYSLVLSSKLPGAKKFKRWVTSEVLPSIRKHGAYATPDTLEKLIADPDTTIRLLTELKGEQDRRKRLEAKVENDAPKVLFADAVAASGSSILIGELAKLLRQNGVEIGQNRLFSWMREHGYLISSGSQRNLPTQRSVESGWFEVKESVHLDGNGCQVLTKTPKVTGRGQTFFISKILKSDGITETMDRA